MFWNKKTVLVICRYGDTGRPEDDRFYRRTLRVSPEGRPYVDWFDGEILLIHDEGTTSKSGYEWKLF